MSPYLKDDEIASAMAQCLRHCNVRLDGAPERVLRATGKFSDEQIRQHVQLAVQYEEARRAAHFGKALYASRV